MDWEPRSLEAAMPSPSWAAASRPLRLPTRWANSPAVASARGTTMRTRRCVWRRRSLPTMTPSAATRRHRRTTTFLRPRPTSSGEQTPRSPIRSCSAGFASLQPKTTPDSSSSTPSTARPPRPLTTTSRSSPAATSRSLEQSSLAFSRLPGSTSRSSPRRRLASRRSARTSPTRPMLPSGRVSRWPISSDWPTRSKILRFCTGGWESTRASTGPRLRVR